MLNSVLLFNRFPNLENIYIKQNAKCHLQYIPKNELNLCYRYFVLVNLEPGLKFFQGKFLLYVQTSFGLSTKQTSYWS